MTTLAEMTQIIARTVMAVSDGTATSGTTSTLVDTSLIAAPGAYNGGTIWVLQSGVLSSRAITTFAANTATFSPVLTNTVAAGHLYSIAPSLFPKRQLEQAVKASLLKVQALKVNTALTVTDGADVTLPAGVSDVRRVIVEGVVCHHWQEVGGKIVFDSSDYNGALEIRYAGAPTEPTSDTSIIDVAVDPEWLHWASVVKIWRDYYREKLKDNPVAIELFNEAKQNELLAWNAMRKSGLMAPARDARFASW